VQFEPELDGVGLRPISELRCQELDEAVLFGEMRGHVPIIASNTVENDVLVVKSASHISSLTWHFEEDVLELSTLFATRKDEATTHTTAILEPTTFNKGRGEEINVDQGFSICPEVCSVVGIEYLELIR